MNWLKNKIEKWAFRHINMPVPTDILSSDSAGNVYLGGRKITAEERRQLRNEAEYIVQTKLWKTLTSTPQEQAKKMMFENENIKAGKYVMYVVSLQENVIKALLKETLDESLKKMR